jgi:hypothetical protein
MQRDALIPGRERGVDGAQLDVGVHNGRAGMLRLDVLGIAGGDIAAATCDPRRRGVRRAWVGRVQPVHGDSAAARTPLVTT